MIYMVASTYEKYKSWMRGKNLSERSIRCVTSLEFLMGFTRGTVILKIAGDWSPSLEELLHEAGIRGYVVVEVLP